MTVNRQQRRRAASKAPKNNPVTEQAPATVKQIIVDFVGGYTNEFNNVVGLDTDTSLGFPRLCIMTDDGVVTNLNLSHVQSYQVTRGDLIQ